MSEVKLNLTDSQRTINGTIHGSVVDACFAAISAEPETIGELESALARYQKPSSDSGPFAWFHERSEIDSQSWDAGIVIIDLAGRIVASESTYSRPSLQGEVHYHDGECRTDIQISYRLPDDWVFLDSIEAYECRRESRRQERAATPPINARAVLYGRPLIEWIASAVYTAQAASLASVASPHAFRPNKLIKQDDSLAVATTMTPPGCDPEQRSANKTEEVSKDSNSDQDDALRNEISKLHATWLMTTRDDLQGQSPRDVLLARQDLIDYDLHTRSMQWSMQGEGPPCLASDSFAYRYAGFGTHEWVIYYDLVRYLLRSALSCRPNDQKPPTEWIEQLTRLEYLENEWLEQPQEEYGGRIPALLIENERIRLPIAMRVHDMVIDDDCPVCQMMANDAELGLEVGFWHLDGSHMDEDFAFSDLRTLEEWEARQKEWQEFTEKFNREWEERQQLERLIGADSAREPVEIELNLKPDPDGLINSKLAS